MSLPSLRSGQIKALERFKEHYYEKENDKGILSACCGFGKTRLCYEIIKLGEGQTANTTNLNLTYYKK
ncbi:helicase/uvrB [Fadolivirus algeromassiliense]|jgi:superfamily II DNA or RNA helicase|uniref:Helicase/uvrB n=1 Tax=Fadolivirus FV1/VV64 TaxID=3070911 RepID=A0A7D3R1T8_9VIRU|nr:helicase/uvrB [Fadolivirus algeromassiliense]QKF94782.1 helicase/uvrB [Fadolivirus FV1/VV64]